MGFGHKFEHHLRVAVVVENSSLLFTEGNVFDNKDSRYNNNDNDSESSSLCCNLSTAARNM